MKRSLRALTGIVALLAASSASAKELPNYNAYYDAQPVTPLSTPAARALATGVSASMDEQRGVPSFLWASGATASAFQPPQIALASHEGAARAHLLKYAPMYGVPEAAVKSAVVTQIHDLGRGGIIVGLRQVVDGVELYRSDVKVLMRRNHELVAISGSLKPTAIPGLNKAGGIKFALSPERALTNALNDLYGTKLSPTSILDLKTVKADYQYYDFLPTAEVKAQDFVFTEPARVKKVYFPMPDQLVPAYFVEFLAGNNSSTEADAYSYVIAADDGRLLYRVNLTHGVAFNYRVWADDPATGGRPLDGPINDLTPHPTGLPDGTAFMYIQPTLVTMDGFNKNPMNTFDPWLPANATVTTGNNVDAYTDIQPPDGFSNGDFRADVTAANTFDRIYNTNQDPTANQNQGKAALAQIFYTTNWLHDWWYDSGFDEAAGNAQQDNFGRGGIGGDPLHAEGEDSAGTQKDNANMSAMSDGQSPRMQMYVWDGQKAGVRADGTIDNGVVAHEWGHYLHLRQVLGCGNAQCGAESEGWGDYDAMQMIIRPNDNLDGAFALAIYAVQGIVPTNGAYFGIRRFPYSTDMTKNALTFKHISNGVALPNVPAEPVGGQNSEAHNAGEIWAQMLTEAYIAILKNSQGANAPYTFQEARRRMSDYVVGGLKMAPQDPTYTEQRDAILAAAAAADPNDFLIIAGAFAKRGAGTCAKSPARNSTTLTGVVEDFGLKPEVSLVSVAVADDVLSCDSDGILDAGETGKVTITVRNTGTAPLTSTTATVTSNTAGVTFPNGAMATFGTIAPFASATVTVDIALDKSVVGQQDLALTTTVADPGACTTMLTANTTTHINYDDVANSSTTDDVESTKPTWVPTSISGPASTIWTRQQPMPPNHLWNGQDYGSNSDTALVSPALNVNGALSVTFKHRYQFEQSMGTNWDGGVIEISSDNGATWQDVSMFGNAGYGGKIGDTPNQAHNPLNGRQGFIGQSAGYPTMVNATLNLGNSFNGKTVQIRFRIGSDDASGANGWDIDDIAFTGISNKPFSVITDNMATCADLPIADAGPDQTVFGGDLVTLDGSKSSDPKMLPLTYAWTETAGMMVTLTNADMVKSTFTAPMVMMDTPLTFQLKVSDGKGSATAMTHVLVKPGTGSSSVTSGAGGAAASGSSSSGVNAGGGSSNGAGGGAGGGGGFQVDPGGCGCTTVGSTPATTLSPLVAFALLALRRRRRTGERPRA